MLQRLSLKALNFGRRPYLVKFFQPSRSVSTFALEQASYLNKPLEEADAELYEIIELEKRRQRESIVLIPSENFTSRAVMDALGSVMQNKYSEGYPGARYYGGNEYIDLAERLCQRRALSLFNLDPERWGVNVQALSGAPANLYVYSAVMKPHDRLMGLDLPHGGHLSHGYQTDTKKISAVSIYFETLPYRLDEKTGLIDYKALEHTSLLYRPKIIVAGASAYPRNIDYAWMRKICDNCGAYLMADMAHISGLVAAKVVPGPFEHADIVTTTTHKSLRGPRGSLIFYRKGVRSTSKLGKEIKYTLENDINFSVFPGHQGGPHNHTIAALAAALKQADSEAFRHYQKHVLENNAYFGEELKRLGFTLVSGGTDTHLLLIDLKPKRIDGARVESVLDQVNIAVNKNTVPGDKSALVPGGLRVGTPAMTSRGLQKEDFATVASYIDKAVNITIQLEKELDGSSVKAFKSRLLKIAPAHPLILELKAKVVEFSKRFPTIGFKEDSMKYFN